MLGGSSLSMIMLMVEWLMVILATVFIGVRGSLEVRQELANINLQQYRNGKVSNTDLDALYSLLKEKKYLRVETISRAFQIPKKTVLDWANILEQGHLVMLTYPRFRGPILTLP